MLAAATGVTSCSFFGQPATLTGLPSEAARRTVALAAGLVHASRSGALVIVLEAPCWQAVLHQAVGVLTFATITLMLWRCTPSNRPPSLEIPMGWHYAALEDRFRRIAGVDGALSILGLGHGRDDAAEAPPAIAASSGRPSSGSPTTC